MHPQANQRRKWSYYLVRVVKMTVTQVDNRFDQPYFSGGLDRFY